LSKWVGPEGFKSKNRRSKATFEMPRPGPDRPKVGADVEFGTL